MAGIHDENQFTIDIVAKIMPVLNSLLKAVDYEADTNSDIWDFAISIQRLMELGADMTDLRWLIQKGFARNAREITVIGDERREFRCMGNLAFTRRTCFVLTELGTRIVRSFQTGLSHNGKASSVLAQATRAKHAVQEVMLVPHWDADARKLHMNGQVVKRFKWPALNQETVLCAFQEEGWPEKIDDPLPPQLELDPKRRLADTIKCLNKNQTNPLIRFHGDGTGEGVVWELLQPDCGANGAEEPKDARTNQRVSM